VPKLRMEITGKRAVECSICRYRWAARPKRPDPRFITCPNCMANVELRPSKLEPLNPDEFKE